MAGLGQNAYSRSPIPSTASYDSSSVSSTASPRMQGGYEGGLMGASPRAMSGHAQHMHLPINHSSFQNPYGPSATSPGSLGIDSMAVSTGSSSGTPAASGGQMSSANLQAQKRAYRQRRKDPSCDACRERKVKCDATETTSCSECSSRNVKCQFTKETNRRMSSIKQVQDLEKQITQVKRENSQLRSMLNIRDTDIVVDSERPQQTSLTLPEIGSHPKRRTRPPPPHDLPQVRANIRNFGRGIFKPPAPYRKIGNQGPFNHPRPELPPKYMADHLLSSYYSSMHMTLPILHWPTFEQEYEAVYKTGSLHGVPPVWISLLFAVLAVGVLFSSEPSIRRPHQGKEFIEISRTLTDMWNDEFVIDHARTAVLTSIFLTEMNLKSAAWTWLASAVRISQDVGLHCEIGPWPMVEGEMRRRVWWGIYVWDRHMSLEMGRPLLIDDADCDVGLPAAIDDHYIHDAGMMVPTGASPLTNFIIPIIHVVRSVSQLIKTLKSPIISPTTLATFDTHFNSCMSAFPPSCQPSANEPLDPRMLGPICHLMNARLVLHRHNLTTSCPPEIRTAAVERCIRAALDSTNLFARAVASSSPSSPVTPFGPTANAMTCMHIWRCTLFLLYSGHFDAALTCIRASSSIATFRDVNVACGRNIAFFLNILIEKRRAGSSAGSASYHAARELDEELIAYISGDLQASTENSWVWAGSETGMNIMAGGVGRGSLSPTLLDSGREERTSVLSDVEAREWGGWEKVEYLVGVLARGGGEGYVQAQGQGYRGSLGGGGGSLREKGKGNERMSITNII